MKCVVLRDTITKIESHPARGAWIEIFSLAGVTVSLVGRTPQGVRGLKCHLLLVAQPSAAVAPRKGCVD